MNNEFDYHGGITTGSHSSWLEENQHLPRLGPLDAWVLPYPSHTPHGRTLVMRTPSPRPLHHVKGALEVPNVGGIWKLSYLLPSRKPTLPPFPVVKGHSNMEVGRLSFPEDGGRSTGSRKHNLELSQISPVVQEFEVGLCACSSRSRPMLEDAFGFLYLWISVSGRSSTLTMSTYWSVSDLPCSTSQMEAGICLTE